MVTYYGLSKNIGNISYYDSTGQQEYSFSKPFSEKTAEAIDKEVKKIVEDAYARAIKILEDNKQGLEDLASRLLEKEVIFSDDLEDVFGKRPWGIETNLLKEMESGSEKSKTSKPTKESKGSNKSEKKE
jgi:cell division protease FtsH